MKRVIEYVVNNTGGCTVSRTEERCELINSEYRTDVLLAEIKNHMSQFLKIILRKIRRKVTVYLFEQSKYCTTTDMLTVICHGFSALYCCYERDALPKNFFLLKADVSSCLENFLDHLTCLALPLTLWMSTQSLFAPLMTGCFSTIWQFVSSIALLVVRWYKRKKKLWKLPFRSIFTNNARSAIFVLMKHLRSWEVAMVCC